MMQDAGENALNERFAFICEYYDSQASLVREYQLFFYPEDNSIEMYDMKQRRTFLRKTKYPQLQLTDLSVGLTVNVFSRQLVVKDYGDTFTKNKFSRAIERLFLAIPHQSLPNLGIILNILADFNIIRARMLNVSSEELLNIFKSGERPGCDVQIRQCIVVEVVRSFGVDPTQHVLDNLFQYGVALIAHSELISSLSSRPASYKSNTNSTMCIIKPHALATGKTGLIVQDIINSGFTIASMDSFCLPKADAEDFLEVYKGVLPEYHMLVDELTTGPCLALELTWSHARGDAVVNAFRELCGPNDPELAVVVMPTSLRAKYGFDQVRNAVHCTDLPEDAPLESRLFFEVLQS